MLVGGMSCQIGRTARFNIIFETTEIINDLLSVKLLSSSLGLLLPEVVVEKEEEGE